MDKSHSNHHFIFVNGLHRSGTSPYRVLSAQSNFSGFSETGVPEDEGQHLQSVYKAAKYYGGPGRFGFDKRSYLTNSSLIYQKNRCKLFDEWSQNWDLVKVFVENQLQTSFEQAFLQGTAP